MRSMRLDCAPVRIGSWDELVAYMEGSAGSVGRIMAPLLGVPEEQHAGFGRLGLAFQHANFIRDVREDRKLDRIYLPAEERDRFGVAEADFDRPAATPELRALVAHEVRRARGLFASAESAVEAAPASVRPGIRLACTIYLGVLDRVEALGYDVLGRRPRLPAWQLPLRRARRRCADDAPRDPAGRRAHAARRARRRADLRRELRRAGGRARARRLRRRRARRSTATRSASARPAPARSRRRGSSRWASAAPPARSSSA